MQTPIAYHFVARAKRGTAPFTSAARAHSVWLKMQRAFPHAIAAVLMPNHLHLIIWAEKGIDVAQARTGLRRILPAESAWEVIPEPQPIADMAKLRIQVRYVHLNPCRALLSADPIAWVWSTHLDYIGVITKPWPKVEENLRRMGYVLRFDGRRKYHQFVSSDVTTVLGGTPLPEVQPLGEVVNMRALVRAFALVTRTPVAKFYRKGRMRAQAMRLLTTEFNVPLVRVAKEFNVTSKATSATPWAGTRLALPAVLQVLYDPRLRRLTREL